MTITLLKISWQTQVSLLRKWKVPEMSQYRVYAKAVAIIDMALCAISMLMVMGLFVVIAMMGIEANEKNFQDEMQKEIGPDRNAVDLINAVIVIYLAVVVVFELFTALQMLAAVRLMSATDIYCEPVQALRFATAWRNISITLLTFGIVGLLGFGMNIWFAVNLLLRGAMIYIVFRYMQELEMMLNTSVPVLVTVQK